MKRFPVTGCALGMLLAGSMALADVRTDYDHNANFTNYHTYSWGPVTTDNPLFQGRIKSEVDKELQAKGWQMVPSGGQTTVFATGNIKDEKSLETNYNNLGGGWGRGWGYGGFGGFGSGFGPGGFGTSTTQTVDQKVGHLVVDVFDSSNHNLLFRGVSDNDINKNSDKTTKALDKNIDKMFSKFPPQGK